MGFRPIRVGNPIDTLGKLNICNTYHLYIMFTGTREPWVSTMLLFVEGTSSAVADIEPIISHYIPDKMVRIILLFQGVNKNNQHGWIQWDQTSRSQAAFVAAVSIYSVPLR